MKNTAWTFELKRSFEKYRKRSQCPKQSTWMVNCIKCSLFLQNYSFLQNKLLRLLAVRLIQEVYNFRLAIIPLLLKSPFPLSSRLLFCENYLQSQTFVVGCWSRLLFVNFTLTDSIQTKFLWTKHFAPVGLFGIVCM